MRNNLFDNMVYSASNPIFFTSGLFLVLFALFLFLYSFIYNKKTARNIYIILFSLYFYYKTSGDFVIVLLGTIVVNYIIAIQISNTDFKNLKRLSYLLGLSSNIFMLVYFKYFNYITSSINQIFNGNLSSVDIIFPIGISFFTFQSISYLTDVFRNNVKPANNILDYAFFVSFFPYIVAGPIVRASDMLPQIKGNAIINKSDINTGLWLIYRGLIKKGIFSYYISQYCDLIFASPQNYSGVENFISIIGYSIDIYLDFSGYSDIAIGVSSILGFKIKPNFNNPYQAKNIIDFWKRWHISLSTWLRDYLFLPLNYFYIRHSSKEKHYLLYAYIFATIFTMLIGGLWHGAENKYLLWGAFHAIGLCINRTYFYIVSKKIRGHFSIKFLGRVLTIIFLLVSWTIFRANNIEEAFFIINLVIRDFNLEFISPFFSARTLFTFMLITSLVLIYMSNVIKNKICDAFKLSPVYIKTVIFIVIIQIMVQIQTDSIQPFIYYQF